MDKNTEEEALVIKCMDEVKSQYVDWYNLGYQTCMAEKKPWAGLTEEEFKKIMLDTYNIDLNVPGHFSDDHLLWAAIEANLKEQNT